MNEFFSWLGDVLSKVGGQLSSLLLKSPFTYIEMSPEVSDVLGYVNYFVPVSACVAIAEAWLLCIGAWYMSQVAMRWLGQIQ